MSIKVTFEFETADAAIAFLEGGATETEKPKRGRPSGKVAGAAAAQDVANTQQTAAVAAPPSPAVVAEVKSEIGRLQAGGVPMSAVVDAVLKLAEIDMTKAKGILAKYGVVQVTQLKVEQYAAVLADVQAASTPTPAAATSLI